MSSLTIQPDVTITLTPVEKWALTKAILFIHYSAEDKDDLAEDPEWTIDVELALEAVFKRLNPQNPKKSA